MNIFKRIAISVFGAFTRSITDRGLVEGVWSHMLYVDQTGAFSFTKLKNTWGGWNVNKPVKYDPNMVAISFGKEEFKFGAINLNTAINADAIRNFCSLIGITDFLWFNESKKSTVPTYVKVGNVTIAVSTPDKKMFNFTVKNWDSSIRGLVVEAACKASSIDPNMLLPIAEAWQYDTDSNGKIVQIRFRYSTNGKPFFGGKKNLQRAHKDTLNKLHESLKKVRLAVISEELLPCQSGNGYFVLRPNAGYSWELGSKGLFRGWFIHHKPYPIVKGRGVVNNNVSNLTSIGSVALNNLLASSGSYDGITSSANLKGVDYADLPIDHLGNAYVVAYIACSKDEDHEKKSNGNKFGFTDLSILGLDFASRFEIASGLYKQFNKVVGKITKPESVIDIDLESSIEDGRIINSIFSKVALGLASISERFQLMGKMTDEIKSYRSKDSFQVAAIPTTHWNGRALELGEIIFSDEALAKYNHIKKEDNNSCMISRAPLASPQSAMQGFVSNTTNDLKGFVAVVHSGFTGGMSMDGDDKLRVSPNLVSLHVPGEPLMVTARAPKPEQVRDVADLSVAELTMLGAYNRSLTGMYANDLYKFCSLVRESSLPENVQIEAIRFICSLYGHNMEMTIQGEKKPVSAEPVEDLRAEVLAYLVTIGLADRFFRGEWDKIGYLDVVGDWNYGFIQTYKHSNTAFTELNNCFVKLFGTPMPLLPVVERVDLITGNSKSNLTSNAIELIFEAQDGKITNAALGKIWAAKVMTEIQTIAFGEKLSRDFCIELDSFESDEWDLIGEECIVEAVATYANIAGAVDGFALQSLNGGALWMYREYQAYLESKSIIENSKSLFEDILNKIVLVSTYTHKPIVEIVEETTTIVVPAKIKIKLPKEEKARSKMLAQLFMDGVDLKGIVA